MAPDEVPLATGVPLTVTAAPGCATVGVTVIVAVPLATPAVYEVVAAVNAGDSAPLESVRPARSAFDESGEVDVLSRIERLLPPEFATARSALPSPLKSPTATDYGLAPVP